MSSIRELRDQAWEANMEIPARNLALYTWGNVSVFDPDRGVFVIKPSGVPYRDLTPDMFPVVDLEGNRVEGSLNPSSDTPTHAALFRELAVKDGATIRSVLHTHSTYATAWAQACRPIPIYGTTHADHLPCDVPCTRYLSREEVAENYERETGSLIVRAFRNDSSAMSPAGRVRGKQSRPLDPNVVQMVLVGGHGPFTWSSSPEKAVYNGVVLEEIARMAHLTEAISPRAKRVPGHIIEKHYSRKHGSGAYYGQSK